MTQGIGGQPPVVPALPNGKAIGTPRVTARQENNTTLPSLAQFALNQSLHRGTPSAGATSPPGLEQELKSLSIFRDGESGRYVALFRNATDGTVTEQIPNERMLDFYSRLEREMSKLRGSDGDTVDVKA